MAVIQSNIDPNPQSFRSNRHDMLALVNAARAFEARVRDTANQKLAFFHKRDQPTPGPGLAHLLDRGLD